MRIPLAEIHVWAGRYSYRSDRDLDKVRHAARAQGFITQDQLLAICRWKSPRSAQHVQENDDAFVREITGISFATTNERVRIEVLTLLSGVSWPTASTVLHYCVSEDYPILDVRALWSLGMENPSSTYLYAFWEAYIRECRCIAAATGVSVRVLDKALWQYSKTNQRQLKKDD